MPELPAQSLQQRLAQRPLSFEPLPGSHEGFARGVRDVDATLRRGAQWVDERVPLLAALDRALGTDPAKLYNAEKEKQLRDEFDRVYQGNLTAQAGRALGQTAVTLPILGGAGAALRAGGSVIGLGGLANYLTGGSNVIGSGVVGNALTGAAATGLTAKQSDEPLGDQLKQGAATGAVLGAGAGALGTAYNLGRALYRAARTGTPAGVEEFASNALNTRASNPLIVDTSEVVPGSPRTLADATGDPNIARLQKAMRNDPAYVEDFAKVEKLQNDARRSFFEQHAGNADTIAQLKADRQAGLDFDTAGLWRPDQVAKTAPVVAEIDKVLNGPAGQRTSIKSTLERVRKQLVQENPDGTQQLVASPEQLYKSARGEIRDLLDPDLARTSVDSAQAKAASAELMGVRDKLDTAIDNAAPGYKRYLANYERASKPITAQQWLQEQKLTDKDGNFTLSAVKKLNDKIELMRRQPGTNPAKDLSDEQLDMLRRLHQDLQNQSDVYNTVKAYGSDTQPNLLMQHIVEGVTGANHAINPTVLGSTLGGVAGHLTDGSGMGVLLGSNLGAGLGYGLQRGLSAREQAVRNALVGNLLNPSEFVPRGPVTAPGMSLSLAPGLATPTLNPRVGEDANSLLRRAAPSVPGL